MPALVVLEGCAPSQVTIVHDYQDGRARVRFASGSEWDVPTTLIIASDGEPPITHPRPRGRLNEDHIKVLVALRHAMSYGLIDDEHEAINGLYPTSAGKRRGEMTRWGYVRDTGTKRPTRRHKPAQVWQITAMGEAALRSHELEGIA